MKLLIEISEEKYNTIKNNMYCGIYDKDIYNAIKKGAPITDGGICDLCKCQEMGTIAVCFHCMAELKGDVESEDE